MLEQSVGEWLESIGLQQYESKLLLNGFDDVRFLVSAPRMPGLRGMPWPKLPTLPMPRAGTGQSRALPPARMVLGGVADGIDEGCVGFLHLISGVVGFLAKILFHLPAKSLLCNLLQKWELKFAGVLMGALSTLCSGL